MNMTHPDILDAERNGIPEATPRCECIMCGYSIFEGEDFYDPPEGPVCENCGGVYMRVYHMGVA